MAGPFGSTSAAAGGIGEPAGDRRKLLIAGLVGLALLAVAMVVLLPGLLGGGSTDAGSPVVSSAKRAPTAAATPSAAVPNDNFALAPAAAYGDPFAQLPEEAAASAAAAVPAPGAVPAAGLATPAATSNSSTSTSSTTTTVTSAPATSSAASAASPTGGHPVQVMKISGSSAEIQVDSKPYTVKEGTTVTGGYTVGPISDGKVQISHNGQVHSLAEGELQTF